jgi:hypothetical protein
MLESIVGKKSVVTTQDHTSCEIVHNGLGMGVQVTKHFIGAPTTNKRNGVMVDVCAKMCHRPRSA